MQILCPLTDWKTTIASRGVGKGNTIVSRQVLAADSWNWTFAVEKQNNPNVVGESFHGNMRMVFNQIFRDYDKAEALTIITKIVKALSEKTNIPVITINELSAGNAEAFGKLVDDTYGSSYMREYPPQVMKKIFKNNAEVKDED